MMTATADIPSAKDVYQEMRLIERLCAGDLATDASDETWKYSPLASRYRELMRIWWTLPNADVAEVLYGIVVGSKRLDSHRRLAPANGLLPTTSKGYPHVGWHPSHTDSRVAKVTKLLVGIDDAK